MNSKLHAVCNGTGKPVALLLTEGQVSDYKGAAQLLNSLPPAKELLADRGYDATWYRCALLEKGITPCVPPKKNRKDPPEYDKELYKQRNKVEIMFAASKTGVELPCAMTGVHTRFSQPSALPASSSFISINES